MPLSKAKVSIELTQVHFLYLQMENHINLCVQGVDLESIELRTDNGSIFRFQDEYIILPEKIGSANVSIYQGDSILDTRHYSVIENDFLTATLKLDSMNLRKNNVLIANFEDFRNSKRMIACYDYSFYELPGKIVQFKMTYISDHDSLSLMSYSDSLTKEQIQILRICDRDAWIGFEGIFVAIGSRRVPLTPFSVDFSE
jgi:hypothetical protein